MATEGKRPGGLTALAVLNFIYAGFGTIGLLIALAAVGAVDQASGGEVTRSAPLLYLYLLVGLVDMALVITCGVGYLGQKKFLGKTLGTVYGFLAIANTAFGLVTKVTEFDIFTIIGLVYPVLTLALLHLVFKDDFPNP